MRTRLRTARSTDGTPIAYETVGAGPPLVLVHGSVSDRGYWAPVSPALAEDYTVVTVDRRGRGASGDTTPCTIEREFEDVAAVVDAIGVPVHLVGHSYGESARWRPRCGRRTCGAVAERSPSPDATDQGTTTVEPRATQPTLFVASP